MKRTVFVTGADRGLGQGLCKALLGRGWTVFAGQYMPDWAELRELKDRYPEQLHLIPLDVGKIESAQAAAAAVAQLTGSLDVLVNNAGIITHPMDLTIRHPQDYEAMMRVFDINALGPLRMVESFLPLLEKGSTRRLCFVSSEAGSIGASKRDAWFGYCMSKAAVNMAIKNLFNDLHKDGYSFRVYHPGWVRSYMSGKKNVQGDLEPEVAGEYAFKHFFSGLEADLPAPDEDRLVLTDYLGREYPW